MVASDCKPGQDVSGKGTTSCLLLSTRYIITYLMFFGFTIDYMLRVTLSVAMTGMVNSTLFTELHNATSHSLHCGVNPRNTSLDLYVNTDGEFSWDSKTQELILASSFYGFILFPLPAGFIADKYPRVSIWLFGFSVGVSALSNLIAPLAARNGIAYLIAVRIMAGLSEGCAFPVSYSIVSRWAPSTEKSRLVAIGISGIPFGQVIGQPIAASWTSSNVAGGWPSAFYFSGTIGVVWFIIWISLAYDSPSSHPRIAPEERAYIEKNIRRVIPRVYPWGSILTSVPVIAVCLADFGLLWVLLLFSTNLPIFLKEVLKFNIQETGFIASVPFLVYWIVMNIGGVLADFLIIKTSLNRTTCRKLLTALGLIPSAVCLVCIGYLGCNTMYTLVLLTLGLSMTGLSISGASICQLDFAPTYAGFISAIMNTVAGTSGFLAPLLVGRYTENQSDLMGWRIVFWISAGILLLSVALFTIFGTAQLQPWAAEQDVSLRKETANKQSVISEYEVSI